MAKMRAKLEVLGIEKYDGCEVIKMGAVCKSEAYPEDGSDEDNTFAMFTPAADLSMTITNPALLGQFDIGQRFYVDFSEVADS